LQLNKNEKTLKKTTEFNNELQSIDTKDLIVLDESGCYLGMNLPYARAIGGARVKMPQSFVRGTKISMIGAVSIDKVEAAIYGEWNTDSEIFNAYIEQKLVPILSAGKVVIMDNVRFHCSEKVKNLIEGAGARVLFLPPYTPELSPIEPMWGKVKQVLKKYSPKNIKEFAKYIKVAFESITSDNLIGWFNHCGYTLNR